MSNDRELAREIQARRYFSTATLLLAAALGGCTRARPEPFVPASAILADEAAIPIKPARGGFTVPVMINHKGPFVFTIDTGCAAVVVSPALAKSAGLRPLKIKGMVDHLADGQEVQSQHDIARAEELTVGGAAFRDLYVRIAKDEDFPPNRGVDGLLGFGILKKLPVTLDMPGQTLRFTAQSSLDPSAKDPTTRPLRLRDGVPIITLTVAKGLAAERGVDVVVDTGCTIPLVLPPSVVSAFDAPDYLGEMETRTFYGKPMVRVERHFTPVEFPGMVLSNNIVVFYADGPVYAMGLPMLRHYAITIDGGRGLLRMALTDPPPAGPNVRLVTDRDETHTTPKAIGTMNN